MKSCTILFSLLLTAACGQAPVPVVEEAHSADDGHDHGPAPTAFAGPTGQMPADDLHAAFQGDNTAPAGAANIIARPRTKIVRSINEV